MVMSIAFVTVWLLLTKEIDAWGQVDSGDQSARFEPRSLFGKVREGMRGWTIGSIVESGFGIYAVLAIMVVFAASFVPEFRRWDNAVNVLDQSAALAVLAIGQTFVIAAGLIDLSVGQLMALVAVLISDLSDGRSSLVVPVLGLALFIGAGVGLINGVLVNRLLIHPLILTFGMLSVLQGAIFLYTDRSIGRVPPALSWLASGSLAGIPCSLLVVALLAFGAHTILQRTRFGWHLQAVGAAEDSARRAGLDIRFIKCAAYVISGLAAAFAGVLLAGRLGTGYPNAGAGFELDAIVAVVLGGTSLAGGRATIPGTLAAVLVLAIASNMLNLLAVPAFGQMVVKGLIVIGAILLTQRRAAPA